MDIRPHEVIFPATLIATPQLMSSIIFGYGKSQEKRYQGPSYYC